MVALTVASFQARFPEFASVSNARVQLFIDAATPYFDVARWGETLDEGMAYRVAHELKMSDATAAGKVAGVSGLAASKSVGGVSVSYAAASGLKHTDVYWMGTSYGQRYLQLRRIAGFGAVAV